MSSEAQPLVILLFPLMAPGHMLPMVDMAKLFSSRPGLKPAVLTTPANVHLIRPSIDRANEHGRHNPIQLLTVPFPPADGLPEGCENLAAVTQDSHARFFAALAGLRRPFDAVLRELRPDCVVTDLFFPWTADAAAEHGLPRIIFHGSGFFSQCAQHCIVERRLVEGDDSFALLGLPHRIVLRRAAVPSVEQFGPALVEIFQRVREAEARSFGTVMNTFYELEPGYADHFRAVMGRRAWTIGPLSLLNKPSLDRESCLSWLDSKEPRSVVYVCFGSLSDFSAAQLPEMGAGLSASGHPFIWVVRRDVDGEELTVPDGNGLIIRGWAPQIRILNHVSVGGFLTHCGWNSILEGVSAGLPLATWPLFAEQFYNERLVVDVLGTGVAVGSDEFVAKASERKIVEAARIEATIKELMGDGADAEKRRGRASELRELAVRAVEDGGSSYNDLSRLIAELVERRRSL